MSDEYSVAFSLDGHMTVLADSTEEAERDAIDLLQNIDDISAASFIAEGCTIRVESRTTYDANEAIDAHVQCVEFPS